MSEISDFLETKGGIIIIYYLLYVIIEYFVYKDKQNIISKELEIFGQKQKVLDKGWDVSL